MAKAPNFIRNPHESLYLNDLNSLQRRTHTSRNTRAIHSKPFFVLWMLLGNALSSSSLRRSLLYPERRNCRVIGRRFFIDRFATQKPQANTERAECWTRIQSSIEFRKESKSRFTWRSKANAGSARSRKTHTKWARRRTVGGEGNCKWQMSFDVCCFGGITIGRYGAASTEE